MNKNALYLIIAVTVLVFLMGCSLTEVVGSPDLDTVIRPPAELQVTARADGALITWRNDSIGNQGFAVQRGINGGAWTTLETLDASTVEFLDTTTCFFGIDSVGISYRIGTTAEAVASPVYSVPISYEPWFGTHDCVTSLVDTPLDEYGWVRTSFSGSTPLHPNFDNTDRVEHYEDTVIARGHSAGANDTTLWTTFLVSLTDFSRIDIIWETVGDPSLASQNSLGLRSYATRNDASSSVVQAVESRTLATTGSGSSTVSIVPGETLLYTRISADSSGQYTVVTARNGFPDTPGSVTLDSQPTDVGGANRSLFYRVFFRYKDTADPNAGIRIRSMAIADEGANNPTVDSWGLIRGIEPRNGPVGFAATSSMLSWDSVSDAVSYEVQVATTRSAVAAASVIERTATDYTVAFSALGDEWFWRVRAVRADGVQGPWSEIRDVSRNYVIGDVGPAGGRVFYDKRETSDGWRFLEAATVDETGTYRWRTTNTITNGTDTGIGTGYVNTYTATNSTAYLASAAARAAAYGSSDDWFLPSRDELVELFRQRSAAGLTISGTAYWSSSEADATRAISVRVSDQATFNETKTSFRAVRVIRRF